jgi:hypothetical protein
LALGTTGISLAGLFDRIAACGDKVDAGHDIKRPKIPRTRSFSL